MINLHLKYNIKKYGNNYKVVFNFNEEDNYIGVYNNKIYYSNGISINYIDFSNNEISDNKWLKLPKIECSDETEICMPNLIIEKALIRNDTLFFSFLDYKESRGLLSINMNAKDFNEYKQIIYTNDFIYWYIN